jgi:hypothetical protein
MSFFGNINTQETTFEMGGGDILPIPKDTRVLAICEEAKNSEYNGERYINLKWRVNQPAEYANRVLFQKLKVYDLAKGEAHKRMLAAIATNAGGKLFAAMQKAGEQEPSDMSLSTITNSPMVLLLDVWELDDKSKSGNWVKSVSARQGVASHQQTPMKTEPIAQPSSSSDIPF